MLGELDHARDDVRLRDGLPRLDGQRRILIGEFLQMLRHEGLARHRAHGGKHAADRAMPRAARCRATMMARSRACRSERPANLARWRRSWRLNYWNGQSFGLDMNQQSVTPGRNARVS